MALALKLDTSTGFLAQLAVGDALDIDVISQRTAGTDMTIGANLGADDELQLGKVGELVRVMGDLTVDGSEVVTTDETITGTFTANGDVNLGSGDGDAIALGGDADDTVTLNTDLTVGTGLVTVGSSVTDYLAGLWLQAVNDLGPNLAAYDLRASGTNAGAYSIGINPSLLTNVSAGSTDLMSALDELDAAISSASGSLQSSYVEGNTIAVTSGEGTIDFSNDTAGDSTTVLQVSRTPAPKTGTGDSFSGTAPDMTLTDAGAAWTTDVVGKIIVIADATTPGNNGSFTILSRPSATSITYTNADGAAEAYTGTWSIAKTSGLALRVVTGGNAEGTALEIANSGSGNALDVKDASTSVLVVSGAGAITATPTSGQNAVITTAGAGVVDINSGAAVTVDAADASHVSVAGANLTLSTTTSGDLILTAAGVLNADAASVEIDATGAVAIESSGGAISIGADAVAQNINIGTGAAARTITVGNASSTEVELDAIRIDLNAGANGFQIDGAGASTIATSSGNLSLDSAAGELVFDDVGNSGTTLSQSGDRTLVETGSGEVLEGVTSIIGAINALADVAAIGPSQSLPITDGVTIAAGDCVAQSATTGRVELWDGNEAANPRFVGLAITGGTGNSGGTVFCKFAMPGCLFTDAGASWTAGVALFGPEGTGRPVALASAPNDAADAFKRLGWAHTSTTMFLDPGPTVILG